MQRVTVQVRCCNRHDADVTSDDVAILHRDDVVLGYRFRCPVCGTSNEVAAPASAVAVLHAFGVSTFRPAPTSVAAPIELDERTQLVSLRMLLDHPNAFASLVRPRVSSTRVADGGATTAP